MASLHFHSPSHFHNSQEKKKKKKPHNIHYNPRRTQIAKWSWNQTKLKFRIRTRTTTQTIRPIASAWITTRARGSITETRTRTRNHQCGFKAWRSETKSDPIQCIRERNGQKGSNFEAGAVQRWREPNFHDEKVAPWFENRWNRCHLADAPSKAETISATKIFFFLISGFMFLDLGLCSCCSCSRHT